MIRLLLITFLSILICANAQARVVVEGPPDFTAKVRANLSHAKQLSTYLRQLISAAEGSSKQISIRPITDDPKTWHYSGKKSRSHTEANDDKKRGRPRVSPTDAIIFINEHRIIKTHKSYRSGTLIHELVHAVDLVKGNYNGDYVIREKRAVFFQNIWRDKLGKSLRKSYHKRFSTDEYQNAIRDGGVTYFVRHYLSNNDLP